MSIVHSDGLGEFQQDNATLHTSRITTEWLQEPSSEFRHCRWSPKSPDMNIIQHIWDVFQRVLQKRKPSSGAALLGKGCRRDETTLRSVYTGAQRHVVGLKVYRPCPNCNVIQVAPAHIMTCIGCHKSELLSSTAAALHCLKTHGFMDLI
ncbi:transposable element tcb2 transposase [Trichonephila clavipes]|nr:transposable element tcb2 transposase [Trichonephila clavipes]